MGDLLNLWEKRKSGELSRDAYRLYASSVNSNLADLFGFISRAGIASIAVEPAGFRMELLDGAVFRWDPQQIGSAPNLLLTEGHYEPFETNVMTHLGKGASTFVDLGANVGYFTIRLSVGNKKLKTIAIEAMPSTATILSENVSLNHLGERVRVVNKAVGKNPGLCRLFVPSVSGHSAASTRDQHPDEQSNIVEVEMTTLSSVLEAFPLTPDDLIKLDVEGAEYDVFQGGISVFERYRPTIFAELLRKWMRTFDSHPNDVIEFLKFYDYKCFQFNATELQPILSVDEETISTNFLFLQDEKILDLQSHGFIH